MKQMSANKPLLLPTDAKGLKFRIQPSDVLQAQFEALGAVPQKLAFSEVYGALQTGVVDGQENTYSNIYTQKFFEVQDGITETNHGVLDYLLVTSTEFWDGLDPDVRDQLTKILNEVTDKWNAKAGEVNEAAKQKILAAGTTIRTLNAEQRAAVEGGDEAGLGEVLRPDRPVRHRRGASGKPGDLTMSGGPGGRPGPRLSPEAAPAGGPAVGEGPAMSSISAS